VAARKTPPKRKAGSKSTGIARRAEAVIVEADYRPLLDDVAALIAEARHRAARAVNHAMVELYWQVGRVIVEREQRGAARAAYGEALMRRLGDDLSQRFGRGFSKPNLEYMRRFFLCWPEAGAAAGEIAQTMSGQSAPGPKDQTLSRQSASGPKWQTMSAASAPSFPLPWSHYVLLLSVDNPEARRFYEVEALRGGWTVRQLRRQVSSQFYERTALSKNKAAMLRGGQQAKSEDAITPEEELRDPLVLEFLDLKDEYSETELEEALIQRLEAFLLELGGDFAFIGRQRRLRVGNAWYRVDLLFFHRALRCLVVIDLKVGELTHADAGQMHLYLNYAREHWVREGENPPVGLILCAKKDSAVARYALEGLPSKVLAAEYKLKLPDEKALAAEIERTRRMLAGRVR